MQVQKITPFLWFDNNAEEAMNFYVSIFKNSKVLNINHSGKAGPGEDGTVMTVHFELDGMRFVGLNGGPMFTFSDVKMRLAKRQIRALLANRSLDSTRASR